LTNALILSEALATNPMQNFLSCFTYRKSACAIFNPPLLLIFPYEAGKE
jgi:hypothetical protein